MGVLCFAVRLRLLVWRYRFVIVRNSILPQVHRNGCGSVEHGIQVLREVPAGCIPEGVRHIDCRSASKVVRCHSCCTRGGAIMTQPRMVLYIFCAPRIGFLDIDEYFVPVDPTMSVGAVLAQYRGEPAASVQFNRLVRRLCVSVYHMYLLPRRPANVLHPTLSFHSTGSFLVRTVTRPDPTRPCCPPTLRM